LNAIAKNSPFGKQKSVFAPVLLATVRLLFCQPAQKDEMLGRPISYDKWFTYYKSWGTCKNWETSRQRHT